MDTSTVTFKDANPSSEKKTSSENSAKNNASAKNKEITKNTQSASGKSNTPSIPVNLSQYVTAAQHRILEKQ